MRPDQGQPQNEDEKAYDVNTHPDHPSSDDADSRRSSEDAQAGVKRIEAVSKAWTLASLTMAYVGYFIFRSALIGLGTNISQPYAHCEHHILGDSSHLELDFLRDK